MVHAAQWQPMGESPSHISHNHEENNVGKAYFGRAFAIEDEQKKKDTLSRPEQTTRNTDLLPGNRTSKTQFLIFAWALE